MMRNSSEPSEVGDLHGVSACSVSGRAKEASNNILSEHKSKLS